MLTNPIISQSSIVFPIQVLSKINLIKCAYRTYLLRAPTQCKLHPVSDSAYLSHHHAHLDKILVWCSCPDKVDGNWECEPHCMRNPYYDCDEYECVSLEGPVFGTKGCDYDTVPLRLLV